MPIITRDVAKEYIVKGHYLRSFPSGWTSCHEHDGAIVVFSIPANKNLGPFLFGPDIPIRELARLWAPNNHRPNLLTEALAKAVKELRNVADVEALVSFADPNNGHHGGIYQAASWLYTGPSSESRVYILPDGRTVSRRSFHSGSKSVPPSVKPVRLPGKHRYVRPLNKRARRALRLPVLPYPVSARDAGVGITPVPGSVEPVGTVPTVAVPAVPELGEGVPASSASNHVSEASTSENERRSA